MELSSQQKRVLEVVKENEPITIKRIAENLQVTETMLEIDLSILTLAGFLGVRPQLGYFTTGRTGFELISEKIKSLSVQDFYSVPIVVKEDISVYEAITIMFLEDTSTLFIVNDAACLAGLISKKDLLHITISKKDLKNTLINTVMTATPHIHYCFQYDSLIDAARQLRKYQISSLPVVKQVNDGLEVIGKITKTTVNNAFVELGINKWI